MLRLAIAMLVAVSPALAQSSPPSRGTDLNCARVTELPLPREAVLKLGGALRQTPSSDAPSVATLGQGVTVTVITECENWREVRTSQGTGWVHRALFR